LFFHNVVTFEVIKFKLLIFGCQDVHILNSLFYRGFPGIPGQFFVFTIVPEFAPYPNYDLTLVFESSEKQKSL